MSKSISARRQIKAQEHEAVAVGYIRRALDQATMEHNYDDAIASLAYARDRLNLAKAELKPR